MFGEYAPGSDSKYFYYNQERDDIETYNMLYSENSNLFESKIGDLIETPRIANAVDILAKWIQYSNSIFVVGPSASGKRLNILSKQRFTIR